MNFRATNEFHCPHCEVLLGGATGAGLEDRPQDGSWTICAECANPCIYVINDEGVSIRKLTEKEISEAKETGFWLEVEQMIEFVKSKPKQ